MVNRYLMSCRSLPQHLPQEAAFRRRAEVTADFFEHLCDMPL
jgi:hypothetical protein